MSLSVGTHILPSAALVLKKRAQLCNFSHFIWRRCVVDTCSSKPCGAPSVVPELSPHTLRSSLAAEVYPGQRCTKNCTVQVLYVQGDLPDVLLLAIQIVEELSELAQVPAAPQVHNRQ